MIYVGVPWGNCTTDMWWSDLGEFSNWKSMEYSVRTLPQIYDRVPWGDSLTEISWSILRELDLCFMMEYPKGTLPLTYHGGPWWNKKKTIMCYPKINLTKIYLRLSWVNYPTDIWLNVRRKLDHWYKIECNGGTKPTYIFQIAPGNAKGEKLWSVLGQSPTDRTFPHTDISQSTLGKLSHRYNYRVPQNCPIDIWCPECPQENNPTDMPWRALRDFPPTNTPWGAQGERYHWYMTECPGGTSPIMYHGVLWWNSSTDIWFTGCPPSREHYHWYMMVCPEGSLSLIFSCDQGALWMVFSVCLSVCLSVCHTFLTIFPSSYHHKIFRSYYRWQKWYPCKRSWSKVKSQGHRDHNPT